MPLEIRRVAAADIPAVRAALIETWHATYDTIYGVDKVKDITAHWHSADMLARQMEQADSVFLFAADRDRVDASSYAVRQADGAIHLFRLYVRPAVHGRGIGSRLMAATFAPFAGAPRHRLEVEPLNHQAISFYERAGFRHVGKTSDCGGSSGVPALIYERQVA